MSFGLGISGALEGASKGTSIGNIIPGLGTAAGGIIQPIVTGKQIGRAHV